jgi:hypothetical protein
MEAWQMEPDKRVRIGDKGVRGTRKRPYAEPTLTKHGDVEEITRVLRRTAARSTVASGDTG